MQLCEFAQRRSILLVNLEHQSRLAEPLEVFHEQRASVRQQHQCNVGVELLSNAACIDETQQVGCILDVNPKRPQVDGREGADGLVPSPPSRSKLRRVRVRYGGQAGHWAAAPFFELAVEKGSELRDTVALEGTPCVSGRGECKRGHVALQMACVSNKESMLAAAHIVATAAEQSTRGSHLAVCREQLHVCKGFVHEQRQQVVAQRL